MAVVHATHGLGLLLVHAQLGNVGRDADARQHRAEGAAQVVRAQLLAAFVSGARGQPRQGPRHRHLLDGTAVGAGEAEFTLPAPVVGAGATKNDWRTVAVGVGDRRHLYVGSTACLEEHEGLLGVAWAAVHPCAVDAAVTAEEAAHRWLAHSDRPATQQPALVRQLIDGDWQGVDEQLADVQRGFEAGRASDVELEQAFAPFHNASPALDAPIAAWLAQAPKSYAAHMTAALHAQRQFERLSLAGFDEQTSPVFNGASQHAEALRQLQAATAFTAKPSLTLLVRYRLSWVRRDDMDDWLNQALSANPDDLLMRREYLRWFPLCPCRGKVPDDSALRRVLVTPASPRVQDALAAIRLFERASEVEGSDEAIRLYTQLLQMRGYPQETYMSNINLAIVLANRKQHAAAMGRLDDAIAVLPGNLHAHDVRGWVHETAQEYPQALSDYLVDAQRGDVGAQHHLGKLLLHGAPGVARNLREAARWIAEASYNGEAESRAALRDRPELLAALAARPVQGLAAEGDR